jgi:hypothetical protein
MHRRLRSPAFCELLPLFVESEKGRRVCVRYLLQ